jgi:hypothetical protein
VSLLFSKFLFFHSRIALSKTTNSTAALSSSHRNANQAQQTTTQTLLLRASIAKHISPLLLCRGLLTLKHVSSIVRGKDSYIAFDRILLSQASNHIIIPLSIHIKRAWRIRSAVHTQHHIIEVQEFDKSKWPTW